MFGENLKMLRKQKGFSQEELAARLHVVRQTISKWEKGLSIPDAEMLIRLAEILEVSVSELLGEKLESEPATNDIAEQLSRINEQLAVKNLSVPPNVENHWNCIGGDGWYHIFNCGGYGYIFQCSESQSESGEYSDNRKQ